MNRTIITVIAVVLALSVGLMVLLNWAMFGDHSSFQKGLAKYEGVPATASDITVYENKNISGVYVADFKISEADFLAFAREKHWGVKPIDGAAWVFQAEAFQIKNPNDKKKIHNGWFCSQPNAEGHWIEAAYDLRSGRAYIYRSSR
jgi:hypothetical protein